MRRFAVMLTAVGLLAACGGKAALSDDAPGSVQPRPTTPADGQTILFERSYVNYAWAPSISGAYITRDGEVYTYDYIESEGAQAAEPYLDLVPGMTEAQLTQKHGSKPKLVATVDNSVLLEHFALVGGAQAGVLLSQFSCADYGEDRYVAYIYDPAKELYTPVPLAVDGDMAVRNTAPAAEQLVAWIGATWGQTTERPCQFRGSPCFVQPCPGAPPCEAGTAPIDPSEQGCSTSCASLVPGCDACAAADLTCITDQAAKAHCVGRATGCVEAITCDCGGDAVCAGGSAYCREDAHAQLSCAAR